MSTQELKMEIVLQNSLDQIKPLNTPKDTAVMLWGHWNDTTRKRIYRWIHNGNLKALRDGKSYWIPHKEITKYLLQEEAEEPDNMSIGNG